MDLTFDRVDVSGKRDALAEGEGMHLSEAWESRNAMRNCRRGDQEWAMARMQIQ